MHREIEIKIKISNEQTNLIKNWLKKYAKFLGIYSMTDYYFNNPKNSFYLKSTDGYTDILNFLRVRIVVLDSFKESFICFKNRHINEYGNTLSVDELEIKVLDGNKAIEIFKNAGFSEITEIKKEREVFLFNNLFEFALDRVDKLGNFLEIELKNYKGSVNDGKKLIYDLLKKIAVIKFVEFDRGYFTIFINPKYFFGKEVNL